METITIPKALFRVMYLALQVSYSCVLWLGCRLDRPDERAKVTKLGAMLLLLQREIERDVPKDDLPARPKA
jgi:hypothetical protein